MANIIKPPQPLEPTHQSVFLAGTIDNGVGVNWQEQVECALADMDVVIFNPRRDEWDASWQQSINNAAFKEQVDWELNGLEMSTVIFMYFAPGSKSPISLLELGLHANSQKIIVVCPHGFWRLGNVEVVASRYKIPLFYNLESGIQALRNTLS